MTKIKLYSHGWRAIDKLNETLVHLNINGLIFYNVNLILTIKLILKNMCRQKRKVVQ